MIILYRLYTEYRPNLLDITAEYFSGATLIRTEGLYQGVTEYGAILEIIGDNSDVDLQCARDLGHAIVQQNKQSLVILLIQSSTELRAESIR